MDTEGSSRSATGGAVPGERPTGSRSRLPGRDLTMEPLHTPAAPADPPHTYRMPLPRLTVTQGFGHGPLDGAWWPRCEVLELELPSLVGLLEPERGATVRVTVDTAQWPDAPPTVMARGREIAVEATGSSDQTHLITLDGDTVGCWVLLVIPPGEPADTAGRLLRAAGRYNLTAVRGA